MLIRYFAAASIFCANTSVLLQANPSPQVSAISFADKVVISPSGSDGVASSEAADFDQDGRSEFYSIATSSTSDPHFRIHDYQPATDDFDVINVLPGSEVDSRFDRFGGDLTAADLNDDGWIDIIVPSSDDRAGAGELSWFENPDGDLDGTWTEHVISTWSGSGTGEVARHMSEVVVGDIDGDGLLDVVTRDVANGVFLLLQEDNTPEVTWQPRRFIPAFGREGLDVFNPDGDNDLDLVLNGVWLETPADPLTDPFVVHTYGADWYPNGNSPRQIDAYASQLAIRDYNGDGRDDIAISNAEELSFDNTTASKPKGIQVYLAPVDPINGTWTEVILETEHFSWHNLEPADLDFDGDIDLVSGISSVGADNAPGEGAYFLNNGDGTSWEKVVFQTGTFIYNSTLADADGDGDVDLFAPENFNSGVMNYYENTSSIAVPPPLTFTDLQTPLFAHWTFDTTNVDEVSGRVANLSNTDYLSGGKIGNALTFDSETDRAEVDSFELPGDELTLACWVFPTSFSGTASEARFISKTTGDDLNEHSWMLGNDSDGSAIRFRLRTTDSADTSMLVTSDEQLILNQWNHVAATYDGSEMKIFLNASEVASQPKTGALVPSSANIGLGNQPADAENRALIGHLDEVRIYERALTATEIDRVMGRPIDDWAFTFGLPAGLPLTSDLDGDGLPLLVEYAFELDPTTSSMHPISFDGDCFVFPANRAELFYLPSYSTDLQQWSSTFPENADELFFQLQIIQP